MNDSQTVSHIHLHVMPAAMPQPEGGIRGAIDGAARYWEEPPAR